MPSFGGYVLRFALPYHIPGLALLVGLFLVDDWRVRLASAVGATMLAGGYLRLALRYRQRRS
jgi:hypothetical protein